MDQRPRRRGADAQQGRDLVDQELVHIGGAIGTGGPQLRCTRHGQIRDGAVGVHELADDAKLLGLGQPDTSHRRGQGIGE